MPFMNDGLTVEPVSAIFMQGESLEVALSVSVPRCSIPEGTWGKAVGSARSLSE